MENQIKAFYRCNDTCNHQVFLIMKKKTHNETDFFYTVSKTQNKTPPQPPPPPHTPTKEPDAQAIKRQT